MANIFFVFNADLKEHLRRCSLRSKERGTRVKDRAKNGASKRAGRGGEERKETLADKPRDFENRPLGLSCLSERTDI